MDWNVPPLSEENILVLQLEIQNLRKRTIMINQNTNESKTKKSQSEYPKEKPACLKNNINTEDGQFKIRTCNYNAFNLCSNEIGGKSLGKWKGTQTLRLWR